MAVRILAAPPEGSGLEPVRGQPGLPFVGNTVRFIRRPFAVTRDQYREFGPVTWTWLFGRRAVVVHGPEAAEAVLVDREGVFAHGPAWQEFLGPFFRRGLTRLDFEEHLQHRRIMQRAFTRDRLRSYTSALAPGIRRDVQAWEHGRGFRMHDHLKVLALTCVLDVFMGVRVERPEAVRVIRALNETIAAGGAIVRFPVPGLRWHKGLQARGRLEEYMRRHLAAKRRGGGDDLFAMLSRAETDDGRAFTDEDVVNHMIFMLQAAHDATATTLAMAAYHLGASPAWQERLREESLALGKPTLEFDDLESLPAAGLVMKEALRLVTSPSMLPRRAIRDTQILGHYIPSGSLVIVPPLTNHRMPAYWTDPERFDPDRFSAPRYEDRVHKYALTPFGGGAHKCIGSHFADMHFKSILHQILLNHRWSIPANGRWPIRMTSLVPKDGLPVHLSAV
ncbi:cytochrome P450 [Actinomadura sp. NAK00032]|uniref:cytochrome P450 n=1 Tax=Actinomadura sp. NAK00032 TaxID=2742128 RepID=UPI0015908E27|nr:cytochrome P450 [Actinomadura sp. NAK00032]QKW37706.1 cytochrome P450 [Actinomadura sp. NAK00032]